MIRTRHATTAGFTLVELMIVVAIVGILAAIAIPTFRRYVLQTRTVEAANQLNKICVGAVAYFHTERLGSAGAPLPKSFPDPVAAFETPADCCASAGQQCAGGNPIYDSDATWRAIQLGLGDAHRYAPFYSVDAARTTFNARTFGDLNCDGVFSMFERRGTIDSSGEVSLAGGVYALRPLE